MVHAGVLPTWTVEQNCCTGAGSGNGFTGGQAADFYHCMYGNAPSQWHANLAGMDRLRVIVNALTRLRFCTAQGAMEFDTKEGGAAGAPAGYLPWFDIPNRQTASATVAFGHWSTLGWRGGRTSYPWIPAVSGAVP